MRSFLMSLLCLIVPLSGCTQPVQEEQDSAMSSSNHIQNALLNMDRPKSDRNRDSGRKSAEILEVSGLMPGMHVLEIEAGRGYFTELLSYAVGAEGHVHVQNPKKLNAFFGKELASRISKRPLTNVTVSTKDFDELEPDSGSIDLVTWVQGPHEIWFRPSKGVSLGDPKTAFEEIYRVLKPGGRFVTVDHIAAVNAGAEAGHVLHRADADLVRTHAEQAGLEFTTSHDFLLRPSDDPRRPSFDRAVRGNTSQFVYVFTKP